MGSITHAITRAQVAPSEAQTEGLKFRSAEPERTRFLNQAVPGVETFELLVKKTVALPNPEGGFVKVERELPTLQKFGIDRSGEPKMQIQGNWSSLPEDISVLYFRNGGVFTKTGEKLGEAQADPRGKLFVRNALTSASIQYDASTLSLWSSGPQGESTQKALLVLGSPTRLERPEGAARREPIPIFSGSAASGTSLDGLVFPKKAVNS